VPVLCQTVIDWLEEWAPPMLAEDGDHIGLQVGSRETEITKALVTLDVTPEVIAEAVTEGAQLIVSHHPLIRDSLPSLDYDSWPAALVVRLVENGIHVYAAHTNLDAAAGGVNDLLAERLGLTGVRVMRPALQETLCKLVVFVPRGHEDEVRQAICRAGAGRVPSTGCSGDGRCNYDECTFQCDGTGTFRPLPGADPFLGQVGELERADESRLETVVPESKLEAVIAAMLAAHPYEEAAYDLYRLRDRASSASGLGRVGLLPEPLTLRAFAEQVRDALGLQALRLAGDPGRQVSRVALCGGSAMALLNRALKAGADVYVTGDVRHHDALNALARGIAVIDAGHHATEKAIVPAIAAYLTQKAAAAGKPLSVLVSGVNTDPLSFLAAAADPGRQKQETGKDVSKDIGKDTGKDGSGAGSRGAEPGGRVPTAGSGKAGDIPAAGKFLIHIDGASRGNPGHAGAGVAIMDERGMTVAERKAYLGQVTNNVAEYQALILALREAVSLGAVRVEINTDSELLARQWNGEYRIQNQGLIPLMQQARRLAGQLQSCTVAHVPRERNKRADALANQAIDEHMKKPVSTQR
jgi:dinuclear metal center YbgI/SA1388 family protein